MSLPTATDVHRIAFSSARYGKQPYSDNQHPFWYGGMRMLRGGPSYRAMLEDDDDENGQEVYGWSKHAERSVPRGHDGALERMTKLPVDILYEIFSHLHPTDVLQLSRANKYLRSILYEEHARSVWRFSLASVRALPTCPPDMTEVQYASLAFDDWCHFCLASGIEDISWVCRVRCCSKCLKKQFVSHDELDLWLPENLYIEQPDSIFPFFTSRQGREGRHKPMYFLPRVREYLRELVSLTDDAAITQWSQRKKDKQGARVKHALECEYWHKHWAFRASAKPSPSYLWELALVVWLSILLMGLWRDKFVEIAGRFSR